MQKTELVHGDLTYKLIGLAMEVHRRLGPGFLEKVYDQAYIIELDLVAIKYVYQQLFRIQYRDQFLRKLYAPDFVVEGKVLVDNKSIQAIGDLERAKMINYLKVTKLEVGLIINYGNLSLEWERVIASDKLKSGSNT